jgi:hypothetical protein
MKPLGSTPPPMWPPKTDRTAASLTVAQKHQAEVLSSVPAPPSTSTSQQPPLAAASAVASSA